MKKNIFPAGLTINKEYLSFKEMKAFEIGWKVQSSQLEEGPFLSQLQAVHTENMQLGIRTYSKSMMFKGEHPENSVLFYIFDSEALPRVDNEIVEEHEIMVGLPGSSLDVIVNSSSTVYTAAIEKDLFYKAFYSKFSMTFDSYIEDKKLLIDPKKLPQFFEWFTAWTTYLSTEELRPTYQSRYNAIENEFVYSLFGFVEESVRVAERRTKFDIVKVRDYLEEHITSTVSIPDVAKALDISERQLHHAFKLQYGMTPKKYLQMLRLNVVNQELRENKGLDIMVSDVAFKYEFRHMSYFTSEYKKLFGETPSQTLNS